MPFLPPDWPPDRVLLASHITLAALSGKKYDLIDAWLGPEGRALIAAIQPELATWKAFAESSCTAATKEHAMVARYGSGNTDPKVPTDLVDIAMLMHKSSVFVEHWGFVIFQKWYYKDGAQKKIWDRFLELFSEAAATQFRKMGAIGNLDQGLPGEFRWVWIPDQTRSSDFSLKEVRQAFSEMVRKDDAIPSGVSSALCLIADHAAVNGVLRGGEHAFLWAIDVNGGT